MSVEKRERRRKEKGRMTSENKDAQIDGKGKNLSTRY